MAGPVTWSGLWNSYNPEAYSLLHNASNNFRGLARILAKRGMTRRRGILNSVPIGQAINNGAAMTYKQIDSTAAPGGVAVNGGLRTINTITKVAAGSTVTSQDKTQLNKDTRYPFGFGPVTYPVDKAGVGAGIAGGIGPAS